MSKMKQFNILHITDLHYGQIVDYEKGADIDDDNLTENFLEEFGNGWEAMFIDELKNWIAKGHVFDYIAFTGDLGLSSGKIEQETREERMKLGIHFLLKLCNELSISKDRLIISPGNHDLNRNNSTNQYSSLIEICNEHEICNLSTNKLISIPVTEGVEIYSIDSCLGATEKSQYIKKSIAQSDKIIQKDIADIQVEVMQKIVSEKSLDIPAIGDSIAKELFSIINKKIEDSCIILMHHNPLPIANNDIRPYAGIVDAGRLLRGLLNTGKNSFILHGHTHFESCMTTYIPNSKEKNYVSVIGSAPLNGTLSAKANILQFYFINKVHIKTDIFEVKREPGLFVTEYKNSIFNSLRSPRIDIRWDKMERNKEYDFSTLENLLGINGETLIQQLILAKFTEDIIYHSHNSKDYNNWSFIRKN